MRRCIEIGLSASEFLFHTSGHDKTRNSCVVGLADALEGSNMANTIARPYELPVMKRWSGKPFVT